MLVARKNNQYVNAFDAKRRGKYYCPQCDESVILKRGKSRVAHFAHSANSKCMFSEGESYEHLLGKQQLFEWARKKGMKAELEVYFKAIDQRADVLIRQEDKLVAFEFQCSPLTLNDLLKRTEGYHTVGINCLWVLGSPYRKRTNQYSTQKFLQRIKQRIGIIFWDVKKRQFELVQPSVCNAPLTVGTMSQDYLALRRLLEETNGLTALHRRLPVICYQKFRGIHFTCHSEIYWRYLVIQRLKDFPLFTSFSEASWYRLMIQLDKEEWSVFPCLQEFELTRVYLQLFTRQLIQAHIITRRGKRIILIKYPSICPSFDQKLIKKNNHQLGLVSINRIWNNGDKK